MSEANFQVALREAERAAKKQKTCAGQGASAVGALQQHLQAVRQQVGGCAVMHMIVCFCDGCEAMSVRCRSAKC